jgi:hypothetical protein
VTGLRLAALPAAHGDALLLEWGGHRMLVDGGPLGTYRTVHDRVAALPSRDVDVLAVTHVDGDHIEGVVRLLQDRRALGLRLGDVWFNGWPQLDVLGDRQGANQGEMVGALLLRDRLPWNAVVGGAPVVVPEGGDLPVLPLPGATATLISPGPGELATLKVNWVKVLAEMGVKPGHPEEALKRLAKRRDLSGIEDLQGASGKPDSSIANASSIALLVEVDGGPSVLLTGDGHGDVLAVGLRRLAAKRGVERIHVDAFKLPHHGSAGNVTDELLGLVDTTRYVVSTNGAKFKHPDEAAILRIVSGDTRREDVPVELVFNYASPTTTPWGDEETQRRLRYTATFPGVASAGAVVEL